MASLSGQTDAGGAAGLTSLPAARVWWLAFGAAGLLYGCTMSRAVLWGDSGEAQLHVLLEGWTVAGQIARSHVVYFALARIVKVVFCLDAAVAANLISALGGAVTVANAAWLNAYFCRTRTAAAAATLMLLVSHTLWQLSTSAEVLTVTTSLFSGELVCVARWIQSRRVGWLAATALFNGLGVSNHNLAMLMWPVYLVTAVRFRKDASKVRFGPAGIAILFLLLGLVPVSALCLDHLRDTGSLAGTLRSLTVGQYGAQVLNVRRLPLLAAWSVAMLVMNFPTPVLAFAISGARRIGVHAPGPMVWIVLGAGIMYGLFGVRYDVPDQHSFLVPFFLIASLWAGIGLDEWLLRRREAVWKTGVIVLSLLGPAVYLVAPPVVRPALGGVPGVPMRNVPYRDPYDWFLRPWRAGYDGAARFARETLSSLPPEAWLVVDPTLGAPLNYVQIAENLRPDVRLDSTVARQPWWPVPADDLGRRNALDSARLFAGSDNPQYLPAWLRGSGFQFEPFGHVFRVLPE